MLAGVYSLLKCIIYVFICIYLCICGPFTIIGGKIQAFTEIKDSKYIYQSELDKFCLQNDTAYGGCNYLPRTTTSDKMVCEKSFIILKNQKGDGC